jgi:RNA polymerase sigma-70 factor (ECF subfamily)
MSGVRTTQQVLEDHAEPDSEVARLRARHVGTWESLFDRMYPRMLAYAQRRLGSNDDARDAVSEAFARMIPSLDRLKDSGTSPDGWCFGILHHVVADLQRHSYRWRGHGSAERPFLETEPSDQLIVNDEHRDVRAAFDLLSARDRDLLELRVVAGLSADEVADILDMRPGAVRMAQARALDRLRSHFAAAAEVDS